MPRTPVSKLVIFVCLLGAPACHELAVRIPNRVQPEEYEVYSAWLQHRFKAAPLGQLYLNVRPMIRDTSYCEKGLRKWLKGDGVLVDQFAPLGEAEYRLDVYSSPGKLKSPWPFKPSGELPNNETKPYSLITFSRVAFNSTHTAGLFAVDNTCGGLCGGGGFLMARKNHGVWTFEGGGCLWKAQLEEPTSPARRHTDDDPLSSCLRAQGSPITGRPVEEAAHSFQNRHSAHFKQFFSFYASAARQ